MKKFLIVNFCFISILIFSCQQIKKNERLRIKNNDTLYFNDVYKTVNQDTLKHSAFFKPRISYIDTLENNILRVWICDSLKNIYSYEFMKFQEYPKINERNYITAYNRKIVLDSLFFNGIYPEDFTLMTPYFNTYSFNYMNKEYIALFSINARTSTILSNYVLILFDITDRLNVKIVLHKIQASDDIKCFGDFNNDNVLDYIDWTVGYAYTDTIHFYSINGSVFEKNSNYYILTKRLFNQYEFIIDKENSKWFYDF